MNNGNGQNPEQEKRTAKALAGLADGAIKVEPTGQDTWHVHNGDKDPYLVVRVAGAWACDCPDWTGRCRAVGLRCKHVEAVRLSPPGPSQPSIPNTPIQKETIHPMTEETATPNPPDALKAIAACLAAPFPSAAVNWKPQAVSKDKTRALAVAYIDARDVMDRLDEVVGQFNWQVEHVEACNQLVTRIGIKNPATGEWVWKSDLGFVGGSESNNEDTQVKAIKGTPSDGLKRAGVDWGIGRYLYKLPKVWVEFDPDKKQLKSTPILPLWAVPEHERHPKGQKRAEPAATAAGNGKGSGHNDGKPPVSPPNPLQPEPPGPNPLDAELKKATAMVMPEGKTTKGKTLGQLDDTTLRMIAGDQYQPTTEAGKACKQAAALILRHLPARI